MKNKQKGPAFEPGDLASVNGDVFEVLVEDEDDYNRTWYLVKPFTKEWADWYPAEQLSKVVSVNVGFNGNDETQMDPVNVADLRELLEVFFAENGIVDPVIDYAKSVLGDD